MRGVLQGLGGLLFAVGAAVLLIRKSMPHGWGELARLVVVLVPTAVLYWLSLRGPRGVRAEQRASRALMLIAAILLTPVVLFELLEWLGASTRHLLYVAGVFALTGALAGYATRRAHVPYAAFLSALSTLIAWLFVWDKILGSPSADTFRWLLVAGAGVLLLIAGALARAGAGAAEDEALVRRATAREVASVGGFTAVAAGVFGVLIGTVVGAVAGITGTSSSSSSSSAVTSGSGIVRGSETITGPEVIHHSIIHTSGLQHPGWNVYLLVVSLALVWVAARARVRGLGYAGALGLLAFVISAGVQITRLESGRSSTASAGGWPLVLIILGAVTLAVSLLSRGGPAGAPPPAAADSAPP